MYSLFSNVDSNLMHEMYIFFQGIQYSFVLQFSISIFKVKVNQSQQGVSLDTMTEHFNTQST